MLSIPVVLQTSARQLVLLRTPVKPLVAQLADEGQVSPIGFNRRNTFPSALNRAPPSRMSLDKEER